MIDQTVVRGTTNGGHFANFRFNIDGNKLLTEYAIEVIRTQTKISLVEGVSKNLEPEELMKKIANRLIPMIVDVTMKRVKQEMKDIVSKGPEAFQKLIQEVVLGPDGENTEGGEDAK